MSEKKEEKREKLSDFISVWCGFDVVVSAKNGVVYYGKVVGFERGFLILRDAQVIGAKYVASTDSLLIDVSMIQHVHSKPKKLEKLKGD